MPATATLGARFIDRRLIGASNYAKNGSWREPFCFLQSIADMSEIFIRQASARDLNHILGHRRSMFEALGDLDSARLDAMVGVSVHYFGSAMEIVTYHD